ncbi:MAG: amino acid ABC transporter permease [Pelagibacterales bacterium]|nr:amino acid ABC transporter permease [Pelagibacterales bacterium]
MRESKIYNWLKENLFSTWYNFLITLLILVIIFYSIPNLIEWAFIDSTFKGSTKQDCKGTGACWVFIKVWFEKFIYGFYPSDQIWRVNLVFISLLLVVSAAFFVKQKFKLYIILFLIFIFPIISLFILRGGVGLLYVETRVWGGLSLTFILTFFGIVISFPLGVLLALGRRSELPIFRYFSVMFIEFWRGVPLITVLFAAAVTFPLFLPANASVDKLLRIAIGLAIFESAYIAEVVRGGLQSLPKGQYEAAKSLGMGYWKMNFLIILPQAIKTVLPGITNTFIALFKDTPLILLVGLAELLGMVNLAKSNSYWLGMAVEGYVFTAIVFWFFCYLLSLYTQNLEKKFSTEKKS